MALNGLKKLIDGLGSFDLEREQHMIIVINKDKLADLQATQLSQAINNKGQREVDSYALYTIEQKLATGVGLGRVTDRVTYYMTGKLYASLFAYISSKTFEVRSPLETWGKMVRRIRKENYGLSPASKQEFREDITIPQLREVFFRKTGLKF